MSNSIHVGCDLHEHLKAIASLGKECRLTYLNKDEQFISRQGQILDIYEARGTDWCELSDGSIIRLDRIELIEPIR